MAREYQRRKRNRETRTRTAHPRIGGLLLALRPAPSHEVAFRRGEIGEQTVARSLERLTTDGATLILHDRRMPGGHGNIDHLAIAPTGVYVIDAKNIKGQVRVANPLFGAPKLLIDKRNRTKLIYGLERQVAVVSRALQRSSRPDVPVQGVLCFTTAELPLLGTLKMRGYVLLHPKALAKRLNASGSLQASEITALTYALAEALPPA